MPDRAVTKQEAARHLGVSVRTVERRIRDGTLRTALVHAHRGSQTRVILDTGATGEGASATPDVAVATNPVAEVSRVEAVGSPHPVATHPDTTATDPGAVALAALRLVDEVMRENAALRARLDEHQQARPWWRFWYTWRTKE